METLQNGFWVILLHLHHSLKTSLLFDIKRCSRLILYFSFSGLGISCPPRSPGFVIIVVFRNQDLDIKCAHCNWGVFASRPFIVQIFTGVFLLLDHSLYRYFIYTQYFIYWYLNPLANAGDAGLIPGLGRCPGKRNGNPLQYSCLGNSMGRGTWWATAHGVAKSQTWLSTAQVRVTGPATTNLCYISISGVGLNNRGLGVQFYVVVFFLFHNNTYIHLLLWETS